MYDIPNAQIDLQVAMLDASLQPAKRNVAPLKDRLDVILEAVLLATNTPMAIKHAMGQSAMRHSDNVAKPAELAMEEHGFDCWNPSLRSNFRMSHIVPPTKSKN